MPDAVWPQVQDLTDAKSSPGLPRSDLWTKLSGPAGVVSAIVAVAALVVAVIAWLQPRGAEPTPSELDVVGAAITRLGAIEVGVAGTGMSDPRTGHHVQDAVVDITLHNRGGSPALIEAVAARVVERRDLEWCPPSGPYLDAGALYDIAIPQAGQDIAGPIRAAKPFQVAPNSFDRLAVTVGPAQSIWPAVYTVELSADLAESDNTLALGTFTIVNPTSSLGILRAQPWSGDAGQEQCVRDNARTFHEVARPGAVAAPDVELLQQRLDTAVQRLDAGQGLLPPSGSTEPAAAPLARCTAAGLPTVLDSEEHAEVTGDEQVDTVLVQACAVSGSPRTVSVVNGTSTASQTLLDESDGVDVRGLAQAGVEVLDGRITVNATAYRAGDPDSRPSLSTTQQFAWDGSRMTPHGARQCTSTEDASPVPCNP